MHSGNFFITFEAFKRHFPGKKVPSPGMSMATTRDGVDYFMKGWPTKISVVTTELPQRHFTHVKDDLWG